MLIGVVANAETKAEWLTQGIQNGHELVWIDKPAIVHSADAYIDLLYPTTEKRLNEWKLVNDSIVIINDIVKTNDQLPANFVRMNGWNSFLKNALTEASCNNDAIKKKANAVFLAFNKTAEWVPDIPGFVSARIVSMIINEAYFALNENISSKDEIDTAMQLGTNYPYGPFEWGRKIGLQNVYNLLIKLSYTHSRYAPSPLLKKEAFV
jgi:3-hydroxybutyryl-CoA dehydrogenase